MTVDIWVGDCRKIMREMPPQSINTVITSPPYFGLRDYGHDDQLGSEATPDEFVAAMVDVFSAAWDVLRDDGTLWLNLGDSYARNGGTVLDPFGGSGTTGYVARHHGRNAVLLELNPEYAQMAADRLNGVLKGPEL